MPNAFTPDENGLNDGYRGNGAFLNFIQNYRMTIWNRWGELIFETEDPFEFWNGRKNNTGNMSQNGVYVAIVEFEGPRGKKYFFKEFATLIR